MPLPSILGSELRLLSLPFNIGDAEHTQADSGVYGLMGRASDTFAQMIDPKVKNMIILDSVIKSISEVTAGYQDLHKDMNVVVER